MVEDKLFVSVGVVFGFSYGDIGTRAKGYSNSSGRYSSVIFICIRVGVAMYFVGMFLAMCRHTVGAVLIRSRSREVVGHRSVF